jgi:hypothetical protein
MFGSGISRLRDSGDVSYRVKFTNVSRRGIIDLDIDIRLYFGKGVVKYGGRRLARTEYSLGVRTTRATPRAVMRVAPGSSRILRLDLRRATWDEASPLLLKSLGIDAMASEESVDLEQLLDSTVHAHLQVRILAYDEVSGTRKYFSSGVYGKSDIRDGTFHGLVIKPWRESSTDDDGDVEG